MEDLIKLIGQGIELAQNAKAMGAIVALAALVKILVDFTKTKFGQSILSKVSAQHKWVRPLVASVLGFAAGAIGALALHKPWLSILMSGIAGVGAAFAGVGAHEVLTLATPAGRASRAASGAVAAALTGGDSEVRAKVEALKFELDKAASISEPKARLSAIAAFMRSNPPAAKP
jgi:hypothetical protein